MEGGAENAEPQHETYALHKKFWLVGGGGGQIGGGPTIAAKAQFASENPQLNLKTLNQISPDSRLIAPYFINQFYYKILIQHFLGR